jgi:hypothetical protein
MSTGKEYNDLILDLLKEQGKDVSDIKEDIAELKTARHVIKEHKEWKREVTDVWSPPQMKESKDEVYTQKGKWMIGYGVFLTVQVLWVIYTFYSK